MSNTITKVQSNLVTKQDHSGFVWQLEHNELVHIILIILGAFIFSWFLRMISKTLLTFFKKTESSWDTTFVEAIYFPSQVLLYVEVVIVVGDLFFRSQPIFGYPFSGFSYLQKLQPLIIGLFFVWFIMRYIRNVENHFIKKHTIQGLRIKGKTNIAAIAKLSRTIIVFIVILTFMQKMNIPLTSLLAFGGLGTVTIGFAAKDTLANFFGGMMIFMDKPFEIGDWVRSPDRDIEGTVEYIGWRLTRIRTFDKRPLYVPNAIFSTISIENPTRMHNRRIKKMIGLRYEDSSKISTIIADIKKMLLEHPDIDKKALTMVNLLDFGESSLNIIVYTFTKTVIWADYQCVQQEILLKIIDIITQHGAECAFPSRTVYMAGGNISQNQIGSNA